MANLHCFLVHRSAAIGASIAMCAFLAGPGAAIAQGQAATEGGDSNALRFQVGLRYWSAQWDTWGLASRPGISVPGDTYYVISADHLRAQWAWIPVIGLRYGAAFASASAMPTTSYLLAPDGRPGSREARYKRQERDVNVGYLFGTGISVSLGHKQITHHQEKAVFVFDELKWQGPVLGLGASAPLASGWGLYTNFGWGQFKAGFPINDAAGRSRYDADYVLGDVGFAYTVQASMMWARSFVITAGYRSQRFTTKGYALGYTPVGTLAFLPYTTTKLQDTTQGFVLGAQALF